jgi:hypothetical protein
MTNLFKNITFLLLFPIMVEAQSQKKMDHTGIYIKKSFSHTAFPDIERHAGHTYQNQFYSSIDHYSDSTVLIFIPSYFKKSDSTDLIFHFHGWFNNIDSVPTQFLLTEQLYQSGKNAILIIPQGPKNAPDSYGGKLEKELVFKNLVTEIMIFLVEESIIPSTHIRNTILSGHSGAYRVMAHILQHGGMPSKIKEVWLFDGLYSEENKFLSWIQSSNGYFTNIYTKDGGTYSLSKQFESMLNKAEIPVVYGNNGINRELLNSNLRVRNIYSPLGHNEIMHKDEQFKKLILASKYLK